MQDIDDITSIGSGYRRDTNVVEDIESIPSRPQTKFTRHNIDVINSDEPVPNIPQSRKLEELLKNVDRIAEGKVRLPMRSPNHVASVRIVPAIEDEPVGSHRSTSRSARNYTVPDTRTSNAVGIHLTRMPDRNITRSERAYVLRQKFQRLNAQNPNIAIPETNDPDALERMYVEAIKTNHYCSTSSTWLIYMGIGYTAFQYGLHKMGIQLPPQFVAIQLEVMSSYPTLLKSLGEPGGPSIGSSWPPWLKLIFIISMHSIIFIIIYKITGNTQSAREAQNFICRTGIMGGRSQSNEGEADNAMASVGGIFGGLGNLFGGQGGGIQNVIGNVMSMFGGRSAMDDIDLEAPPEPISNRSQSETSFNSRRPTPFDR